ncbi:MerR family transcriptional regulator [Clostridium sp. WILCCON 0269]|uniref:MerR family transcriptional regulator n=1 Tax=Candidatus Clostridium eludens TaxID=3381663 RepID=A0ABW8SQC9_9CLOT
MENNMIILSDSKPNNYKTKDVAEMLNTSTQTIRNYCATFKSVLDTSHKNGQHRNFIMEDIDKLKLIRYLLKEKQMTANQVIKYFENPESNNYDISDVSFKLLVQALSDEMLPKIENIIAKNLQFQTDDIKGTVTSNSTDINSNIIELLSDEEELRTTINQIRDEQTQYISRVEKRKAEKRKRLQKFQFWRLLVPGQHKTQEGAK